MLPVVGAAGVDWRGGCGGPSGLSWQALDRYHWSALLAPMAVKTLTDLPDEHPLAEHYLYGTSELGKSSKGRSTAD
jgi:hypothetical protein